MSFVCNVNSQCPICNYHWPYMQLKHTTNYKSKRSAVTEFRFHLKSSMAQFYYPAPTQVKVTEMGHSVHQSVCNGINLADAVQTCREPTSYNVSSKWNFDCWEDVLSLFVTSKAPQSLPPLLNITDLPSCYQSWYFHFFMLHACFCWSHKNLEHRNVGAQPHLNSVLIFNIR